MKILFLCGIYNEKIENDVMMKTKGYYDVATLIFERKLLKGLRKKYQKNLSVLSAPYIGSYPNRYKDIYFKAPGRDKYKDGVTYCSFNNIWGFRNYSRYFSVKRKLKEFVECSDVEKYIIVYATHSPFMKAAKWAKDLDNRIKICQIVSDLPAFQSPSKAGHMSVYGFFKFFDVKLMDRLGKSIDSYVVLTRYMKKPLNVGDRPCVVVPGIIDSDISMDNSSQRRNWIVYTGNLNRVFGIMNLVKAFHMLDRDDYRLIICGDGSCVGEIREYAAKDSRIEYRGVVKSVDIKNILCSAKILVSPRMNNGEYTKYSIPSKILDYLAYGGLVVSFSLYGMDDDLRSTLLIPEEETEEALRHTLENAIEMSEQEITDYRRECIRYMENNIVIDSVVNKIDVMLREERYGKLHN